jgi:branched-chain amino acid aminotransferase
MKKSKKIWLDGKFIDWDKAKIHVLSHVVQYGSGVFEGIRLYKMFNNKSTIFRLQDHTNRMFDSAKIYCMSPLFSKNDINKAIINTVKINNLKSAYIRPLVFRGYGTIGIDPETCPIQVIIAAFEWGTYMGDEALCKGINACISSWHRLATNTIPSLSKACGNYLNSQLIRMEAKEKGFKEGIALDVNGFIAEGSGENIFVVKNEILYTIPFSDSILPGITRDSIIKLAKKNKIKIIETRMPREFLYLADEVFMVGTAVEITPIIKIDQYKIGNGTLGKTTQLLQNNYFDLIKGKTEDVFGWLTII